MGTPPSVTLHRKASIRWVKYVPTWRHLLFIMIKSLQNFRFSHFLSQHNFALLKVLQVKHYVQRTRQWNVPATEASDCNSIQLNVHCWEPQLASLECTFRLMWPRLTKGSSWFSVQFHRAHPLRMTRMVIWERKCPRNNKACATGKVWPEIGRHCTAGRLLR